LYRERQKSNPQNKTDANVTSARQREGNPHEV
jgi:hypothetical protein